MLDGVVDVVVKDTVGGDSATILVGGGVALGGVPGLSPRSVRRKSAMSEAKLAVAPPVSNCGYSAGGAAPNPLPAGGNTDWVLIGCVPAAAAIADSAGLDIAGAAAVVDSALDGTLVAVDGLPTVVLSAELDGAGIEEPAMRALVVGLVDVPLGAEEVTAVAGFVFVVVAVAAGVAVACPGADIDGDDAVSVCAKATPLPISRPNASKRPTTRLPDLFCAM